MRKTRRRLSLLLVFVLAATRISVAAATFNFRTLFTLRPVELLNTGGVTVTAGGEVLEQYGTGGKDRQVSEAFSIPVTVVNTTDEKFDLSFSDTRLNGRRADLLDARMTLRPGGTVETVMNLSCSVLTAYGVKSLEQIRSLEVKVTAYYADHTRREIGTMTLSAKLLGLSPREADPVPFLDEMEPRVLFEGDGLTVWMEGMTPEGNALDFCLVSNRAEPAQASLENIVVNGWQIPYDYSLMADPGGTNRVQLRFGDDIPGYAGLASVTFDLYLLYRDEQTSLEKGGNWYVRLSDEPVRVSLVPAHPAEVPEPEGWIPAAERDGLQILYRGGFSKSKSNVVLSLLFINGSEQKAWLGSREDPFSDNLSATLRINGQPIAADDFFGGTLLVSPGAKQLQTLCIANKSLSAAGIKWNEIHSADFDIFRYPYDSDEALRTIPVHIDFE